MDSPVLKTPLYASIDESPADTAFWIIATNESLLLNDIVLQTLYNIKPC